MAEVKLKWLYSYDTVAFDTADGLIHEGEYCIVDDSVVDKVGRYIISDPSGKYDMWRVKDLDTTGMKEIHISGAKAYNVFQDPDDGKIIKEETTTNYYESLMSSATARPSKTITKAID